MLHFDVKPFEEHFLRNLIDYCDGGPRDNGYTRSGKKISVPEFVGFKKSIHLNLSIEECFSKNKSEVNRWHVSFLQDYKDLEKTNYYKEYLIPRYHGSSKSKALEFIGLFESMARSGYIKKFPVLVVDISEFNFGFQYFRFDGCHRLSSAYVLGMKSVPAIVFTLKDNQ
jgi:uncharacterized ParB-like nuclease family protein